MDIVDYTHLTGDQAMQLRHERVQALEAEHWRLRLAAEEHAAEPPEVAVKLGDLERRIQLHRDALGIVVPPPEDGGEQGDTPRSGDENAGDQVAVPDAVAHDDPH